MKLSRPTEALVVDRDQAVRDDATLEGMKNLKPAFKPMGSSRGEFLSAERGAASMLLMSKETAKKKASNPWRPSARLDSPEWIHHHGVAVLPAAKHWKRRNCR